MSVARAHASPQASTAAMVAHAMVVEGPSGHLWCPRWRGAVRGFAGSDDKWVDDPVASSMAGCRVSHTLTPFRWFGWSLVFAGLAAATAGPAARVGRNGDLTEDQGVPSGVRTGWCSGALQLCARLQLRTAEGRREPSGRERSERQEHHLVAPPKGQGRPPTLKGTRSLYHDCQ